MRYACQESLLLGGTPSGDPTFQQSPVLSVSKWPTYLYRILHKQDQFTLGRTDEVDASVLRKNPI